jgi:hypothetical protein
MLSQNLLKTNRILEVVMEIKKAHKSANVFALQQVVIQNMRQLFKKCMSTDKLFLKVIFLLFIFLFYSTNVYAMDTSRIDNAGRRIYYFVVALGKWVIIVKGAVDVITAVVNGDFQNAKKLFIGYIFAFGILFAMPWMFDEIENIFKGM